MSATAVKLAGRQFVILPLSEYRRLTNGAPQTPRAAGWKLTKQDLGDLAESRRRLSDPRQKRIPLAQLKRDLRALPDFA